MIRKPKGKIVYGDVTDVGLCRKENQDTIYSVTKDDLGLFVLADGMGGHKRGEIASQEIISFCRKYMEGIEERDKMPDFLEMTQEITEVLRAANEHIFCEYVLIGCT